LKTEKIVLDAVVDGGQEPNPTVFRRTLQPSQIVKIRKCNLKKNLFCENDS